MFSFKCDYRAKIAGITSLDINSWDKVIRHSIPRFKLECYVLGLIFWGKVPGLRLLHGTWKKVY